MIDPTSIAVIENAATQADALAAYEKWCAFREQFKEMNKLAEAAMTKFVREQGGSVDVGSYFLWLTHSKDWKCRDVAKALDLLLQVSNGDVEAIARDFLASQPIKCGSARKAIGDALFEQVVRDKLETGEALPKKLQKVDKAFLTK